MTERLRWCGTDKVESNEALVSRIQAGEKELLPALWEQVRRFIWQQAERRARELNGQGGVTAEDLVQSGYFALLDAVEHYDPARGSFLTLLGLYLRSAFAAAAGYHTGRQRREPLNRAESLDRTIDEDDEDGTTVGELVADRKDLAAEYEEADFRAYRERTVNAAVDALPETEARVLRLRYWQRLTLERTAAELELTRAQVYQEERRAFQALRRKAELRELRRFVDYRTDFFRGGINPVEANVIFRDTLEQNWRGRHENSDFLHTGGKDEI